VRLHHLVQEVPVGSAPARLRQGRLDAHLPDVPDAPRQQAGRGQLPAGDGRGSDRLEGHRGQARQEEAEEGVLLTSRTFAPLRLGTLQVDTPVVLAPRAGITNAAYRRLCAEQGAGLYVCEMITSRGLVEGDATTRQMLVFDDSEDVRSVQLYGIDPTYVGKATEILCTEYGVAHVDLNFGCPVPKVTRKGGGAAL